MKRWKSALLFLISAWASRKICRTLLSRPPRGWSKIKVSSLLSRSSKITDSPSRAPEFKRYSEYSPRNGRVITPSKVSKRASCSLSVSIIHVRFASESGYGTVAVWSFATITPASPKKCSAYLYFLFIIVCYCAPLWGRADLYCFYYRSTTIIIYCPNVKGLWTQWKKSDPGFQSQT